MSGTTTTGQDLLLLREVEDLHEADLDAELLALLPEAPVPGGGPC